MGYPISNFKTAQDNISYPSEFKKEVQKVFPEWEFLLQCTEEGRVCVRALLAEWVRMHPVTPEEIMAAKSLSEIQIRAQEVLNARGLENWCSQIIQAQRK